MTKRLLATVLSLCILMGLFPVSILAAGTDGNSAENPLIVPVEGLAFHSGTVYGISAEWFREQIGDGTGKRHFYLSIEIPEKIQNQSVTAVGKYAFNLQWSSDKERYGAVNSHNYPDYTFTVIGADFTNATALTTFSSYAFSGCSSLSGIVDLSATKIHSIEKHAFLSCKSLMGVVLPDSLTEIGAEAFLSCSNLHFVTTKENYNSTDTEFSDFSLPDGLQSIGNRAFANAFADVALTVVIPESVTSLGAEIFYAQWGSNDVLSYLPVRTIIVKGTDVTGFDSKAFKFYDSGSGIDYPPRVTVMPDEATYTTFMKKAGGLQQDKKSITYPLMVSFYASENAGGAIYQTEEKLYNQSIQYEKDDEIWQFNPNYELPKIPQEPTKPGYVDHFWMMDGKTLTINSIVTSNIVTLGGGNLADPSVKFSVKILPKSGSAITETVENGATVTLNVKEAVRMDITPIIEHPLQGDQTGDTFFWYKWNDSTGERNDENGFQFGKTINTLKITEKKDARTDADCYRLDLQGKTVTSSWGPSYDWDGDEFYASSTGQYYLYVDVIEPPENLSYIAASEYQYFIENKADYHLATIYTSADELIEKYLLEKFGEKTYIESDAWSGDYLTLDWNLKDDTTYSSEPGVANQFTWTASYEEFEKLGWTNLDNISFTGDVTVPNPYAITFQADGTLVATKYIIKGEGLAAEDFPPVPEKKGYTGVWNVQEDITNVTSNQMISAVYTPICYSITYELSGGVNANENPTSYTVEKDIILAEPSRAGYTFTGWSYAGQDIPQKNLVIQAGTVTGDLKFTAHWSQNTDGGGGDGVLHYIIQASAGEGGSISPRGRVEVSHGSEKTFRVSANSGYTIADVIVDGKSIGTVNEYTFKNIRKNHTIQAVFKSTEQVADPDDTGISDWLNTRDHDAYLNGYENGTFHPDGEMTRGEVAQMFYNLLLDKDIPITATFTDVSSDTWYAKAINTLASIGVIQGRGNNRFEPDQPITRAEFTVIAMRFAKLDTSGENIFTDVSIDDWFYDQVVGSIKYGWINGYSDGTFRPNQTITRAEVTTITNRILDRAADKNYVDAHSNMLRHFPDVSQSHWAYYPIVEATNAHTYDNSEGTESWTESDT